jgi:hypothetical protein
MRQFARRSALILLLSLSTLGCEDKIIIQAPTAPDPPPTPQPDRIEFRVSGSFRSVTVRHVTAQDGTSQVKTDLPYFNFFTSTRDFLFLSLEAWAAGEGFLQVQIWANGYLLQEASISEENPRISIATTFRRAVVTPTTGVTSAQAAQ